MTLTRKQIQRELTANLTMSEAALELQLKSKYKRQLREARKPNPIVEYVSLLNLCYHHAIKRAA